MIEQEMVDGRVALVVELGLTMMAFGRWRRVPVVGEQPAGKWLFEQRLYWVNGDGMFHSGPFASMDEGLTFLVKWHGRALD
jgi:hypothetical protein